MMTQTPKSKAHPVRWSLADWRKLTEAARLLQDSTRLDATPTDIIRQGARRLAEEIIAANDRQRAQSEATDVEKADAQPTRISAAPRPVIASSARA